LPIDFATTPLPLSLAILSPSACIFNDHYARISSPSPDVHASRSAVVEQTSFATGSPGSAVSTSPSTDSLAGLQLCVDLSSYPLQQLTGTGSSPPRPAIWQRHMILRPRQPKTTLPTTTTTATAAPINQVASPPTHEPIAFTDINRYKAWHSSMREEIQAFRANKTWSLVSFSSFNECYW